MRSTSTRGRSTASLTTRPRATTRPPPSSRGTPPSPTSRNISLKRLGDQRRGRLDLAPLDPGDDLDEPRVAGRRHAGFGALARDVAVHGVDLRAPALQDVLRHRRALDVGARVGAGLRHDQRFDFGARALVALRGARHGFGLDASYPLELVAERLTDAYCFAGKADLEAPDGIVSQAVACGKPGGGGHGVTHRVLHQLRPTLAPKVGSRFRAVDSLEPLEQLLDPRRDAPVRLADAEDRMLVAAFGHRPADAARLVE